ncbi:MAG: hypothetical protein ALECFALPRED_000388 [Alectoria fallacina]|uniref:Uncharacterized protein n=1 Tax=Alectoria fallacina TaxID=1903189 RepID=A0A8H3FBR3_9LECA|nr:MAG: hypothetical protein ALECFALPRED_000388 [Alectoria fallacina]
MVEIAKDDEITISYRPATGYHTRTKREIELRKWSFYCGCGACQPRSLFGAGSDARRLQMRRLQDKIDTRNYPPGNIIQRLHDIGKLEYLLRQEELIYPMLADVYHLAAEWYRDTLLGDTSRAASYEDGNRKQALELARKELDLDVACTGHRSTEVAKTLRFIRQLQG